MGYSPRGHGESDMTFTPPQEAVTCGHTFIPVYKTVIRPSFIYLFIYWSLLGLSCGNGTPLQYSCLENPMDGGAW